VTTAVYGAITFTVIDFNFDPRNTNRSNQNEITVLLQGRMDVSNNLITNPADQLQDFLETWAGISSGLFNSTEWTLAHNTAIGASSPALATSFAVIDPDKTFLDVISDFNQSVCLWFFVDQSGLYGCFLFTTYTGPGPDTGGTVYSDQDDIKNLKIVPTKTIATRMAFNSSFNLNKNAYEHFSINPTLNLFNATALADAPQDYWRMDAPSGATETDTGTGGHNGTYVGSPTLGATGALAADSDTAVTFNGTTQTMNASPGIAASHDYTIELWFKSGGNTTGSPIIVGNSGAEPQLGGTDSGVVFYLSSGSSCNFGPVTANTWYHVVGTYKNSTGLNCLYKNGVLVDSVTNAPMGGFTTLHFASSSGAANFWKGTLDEVMVYSTVLTAARVLAHYQAGAGQLGSYSIDTYAELTLGQIAAIWDLPCAVNAANAPWNARLQLLSESQDYAVFDLPIDEISGLDLTSVIALTAERGVGRAGYNRRGGIIVGMNLNAQPAQMKASITLLMFSPLYSYDPSAVTNNNSMPSPWTCAVDGGGNSANHISSGLIEMRYNASTAGTRAIFPSTDRCVSQQSSLVYSSGEVPAVKADPRFAWAERMLLLSEYGLFTTRAARRWDCTSAQPEARLS
jgi:hypothetical protein